VLPVMSRADSTGCAVDHLTAGGGEEASKAEPKQALFAWVRVI
jgi:hypothetical protein